MNKVMANRLLGVVLLLIMGFFVFVGLSGLGFMIAAVLKYLSWYHIIVGKCYGVSILYG